MDIDVTTTEGEPLPQNSGKGGIIKTEIFIIVVALLVAIVGGAYWYVKHSPQGVTEPTLLPGEENVTLEGRLYYTIAPGARSDLQGSYYYDFATRGKGGVEILPGVDEFFPVFTGSKVAAFLRMSQAQLAVKALDMDLGNKVLIEGPVSSEQIGSVAISSSADRVAVSNLPYKVSANDSLKPEVWVTSVYGPGTTKKLTVSGVSPAFVDTPKGMVYLDKNGIEFLNVYTEGSTPKLLWDIDTGTPGSFMHITSAVNVPIYAFSNPQAFKGAGVVQIFSISANGDFVRNRSLNFSADALALSPDGQFVALQVRREGGSILPGAGKVVVVNILTGKTVSTLLLEQYSPLLKISSWASKR